MKRNRSKCNPFGSACYRYSSCWSSGDVDGYHPLRHYSVLSFGSFWNEADTARHKDPPSSLRQVPEELLPLLHCHPPPKANLLSDKDVSKRDEEMSKVRIARQIRSESLPHKRPKYMEDTSRKYRNFKKSMKVHCRPSLKRISMVNDHCLRLAADHCLRSVDSVGVSVQRKASASKTVPLMIYCSSPVVLACQRFAWPLRLRKS